MTKFDPDLQEQIDACPDCQRFKPVICVTHRRAQVALEANQQVIPQRNLKRAAMQGGLVDTSKQCADLGCEVCYPRNTPSGGKP
jgi:hypothetical protein